MVKRAVILVVIGLLCLWGCALPAGAVGQDTALIIAVKGEINPAWLLYLERSLKEAKETGAGTLVLNIDTPGGYVDTALKARELLWEFEGPVYAYVNPRALSAGAYLALVADYLYMAPGSTIGAAELRIAGGGEISDEKMLSSWEADMRAAAERNNRDPQLAAAMVRREMEIDDLVEAGELLTLTDKQGERLDFIDGTAQSLPALLEQIGFTDNYVSPFPTPWEQIGGWLINPVIAAILLSLAFLFLVVEVLTAGFGLAGLLSILCFALYFGGRLFSGASGWPAVLLFIFGLVLMLIEAFIPGFGIFGISGLLAVGVSIVLSAATAAEGLRILLYSLLISAFCGYLLFRYFQRRGVLRRFILSEAATRERGYSAGADLRSLAGKQGTSITALRPSGTVEVEGAHYDVVSEGTFIPAGVDVIVIKVEGRRVVVRKLS